MTDKAIEDRLKELCSCEPYGINSCFPCDVMRELDSQAAKIVALRKQIDRMERADDLSNCND